MNDKQKCIYVTFPAQTRSSTFYMNACRKFQFGWCQNFTTVSLMTDKKFNTSVLDHVQLLWIRLLLSKVDRLKAKIIASNLNCIDHVKIRNDIFVFAWNVPTKILCQKVLLIFNGSNFDYISKHKANVSVSKWRHNFVIKWNKDSTTLFL